MKNLLSQLSQVTIDPGELDALPQTTATDDSVATILELAFTLIGSIAFLVIVIAGLRFVLSRGNADSAAKARNTIIYAVVGLVIAVLAFSIVRFVVRTAAE